MTATIAAADVRAGRSCGSSYSFRPRASLLVAPAADRRCCCDDPPVVLAALRRGVDPRAGHASGARPIDVQFELLSRHGPQITARRDRGVGVSRLATELQPPSATRRRPVWQFPAFRQLWLAAGADGGWILSRAVASDGSHRPGSSLSGCSLTTDRDWTLFNGILRSKTQSWGPNLNAAMPAMKRHA